MMMLDQNYFRKAKFKTKVTNYDDWNSSYSALSVIRLLLHLQEDSDCAFKYYLKCKFKNCENKSSSETSSSTWKIMMKKEEYVSLTHGTFKNISLLTLFRKYVWLREAFKKKKKLTFVPQNCASENHFLIIFWFFFLHKLPLPP